MDLLVSHLALALISSLISRVMRAKAAPIPVLHVWLSIQQSFA